eukprot:GFYU01006366.1.p1 GENE.GFYU01006366.1~~GFYU01006366.1.p1  ORF type:complete len:224 (-),score=57.08 GFYU01006366.1:184-855(-)
MTSVYESAFVATTYGLAWVMFHQMLLVTTSKSEVASTAIRSSVFCGVMCLWSSYLLYTSFNMFDVAFPFKTNIKSDIMLWGATYFVTDSMLDPNPTFYMHHGLSALAFFITYCYPNLNGVLLPTVLIAEIGGLAYNLSKAFRGSVYEVVARKAYFFIYAVSRVFFLLPWTIWLLCAYYDRGINENYLANGISCFGAIGILYINLVWLKKQWTVKPENARFSNE